MKKDINILSFALTLSLILLLSACKPESDGFSLSCGNKLTIAEGDVQTIQVNGGGDFSIKTNNNNAVCVKKSNAIEVTGAKVGTTVLTVSDNGGTQLSCTITVTKSDAQKNFITDRTPRIENWLQHTVYTQTTAGLQVSRERNVDADGYVMEGSTTFGFYEIETGNFCRISAKGDFSTRGTYPDGKVAICNGGETNYYLCDKIEVQKIYDGIAWIVVTCDELPEIRVVTEVF